MNIGTVQAESQIFQSYIEATPTSAELYRRAQQVFPCGVTHQARVLEPHPVFVARAQGGRKWDVDGREYVDYFGGHGALMLGHNHSVVQEAVREQVSRGTHYGASHQLELEWAELIRSLVPSAERVRFTVSGTEATHLALRVARAYTGKPKLVRFATHFHGWHDHVAFGKESVGPKPPPGILQEIVDNVLVCPPGNLSWLDELCRDREDVAAVILEPTGATFGKVPLDPAFLPELREWTARRGILLIFDEVVSGFRCSLGGAQGFYGVTPDLTTLAKIVGGGYPGAALVGRAEVMQVMDAQEGDRRSGSTPGGALRNLQRSPGHRKRRDRHLENPAIHRHDCPGQCQRSQTAPGNERGHPTTGLRLVRLRRFLRFSHLSQSRSRTGYPCRYHGRSGGFVEAPGSRYSPAPAQGAGRVPLQRRGRPALARGPGLGSAHR